MKEKLTTVLYVTVYFIKTKTDYYYVLNELPWKQASPERWQLGRVCELKNEVFAVYKIVLSVLLKR